jgi:hypothetical protein
MAYHGSKEDGIMGLLNNPMIPKITIPLSLEEMLMDRAQMRMIISLAMEQWGQGQFKSSGAFNRIVMGKGLAGLMGEVLVNDLSEVSVLDRLSRMKNAPVVKEAELDNIPTNCGGCTVSGMFLTRVPNAPSPLTAIQRKQPIRFGVTMPEMECDGTLRMKFFTRIASTELPNPGDGLFILFNN